jgi:hypothetical protein
MYSLLYLCWGLALKVEFRYVRIKAETVRNYRVPFAQAVCDSVRQFAAVRQCVCGSAALCARRCVAVQQCAAVSLCE